MKSQTLESKSPKTSKQKALLEMLSPLQCHSQVYDGTLVWSDSNSATLQVDKVLIRMNLCGECSNSRKYCFELPSMSVFENLDAKAHANFYWAELISKPTNHVPALFFAAKHWTTEQFNVDQ